MISQFQLERGRTGLVPFGRNAFVLAYQRVHSHLQNLVRFRRDLTTLSSGLIARLTRVPVLMTILRHVLLSMCYQGVRGLLSYQMIWLL